MTEGKSKNDGIKPKPITPKPKIKPIGHESKICSICKGAKRVKTGYYPNISEFDCHSCTKGEPK